MRISGARAAGAALSSETREFSWLTTGRSEGSQRDLQAFVLLGRAGERAREQVSERANEARELRPRAKVAGCGLRLVNRKLQHSNNAAPLALGRANKPSALSIALGLAAAAAAAHTNDDSSSHTIEQPADLLAASWPKGSKANGPAGRAAKWRSAGGGEASGLPSGWPAGRLGGRASELERGREEAKVEGKAKVGARVKVNALACVCTSAASKCAGWRSAIGHADAGLVSLASGAAAATTTTAAATATAPPSQTGSRANLLRHLSSGCLQLAANLPTPPLLRPLPRRLLPILLQPPPAVGQPLIRPPPPPVSRAGEL